MDLSWVWLAATREHWNRWEYISFISWSSDVAGVVTLGHRLSFRVRMPKLRGRAKMDVRVVVRSFPGTKCVCCNSESREMFYGGRCMRQVYHHYQGIGSVGLIEDGIRAMLWGASKRLTSTQPCSERPNDMWCTFSAEDVSVLDHVTMKWVTLPRQLPRKVASED